MNTSDKIKSIIEKIAHLRALASKAGTQAEAEAAAGMAEKLIAQYEIEEADLEARGDQASENVEEADPLHVYAGTNAEGWRGSLAHGLANVHGCFSYQSHDAGKAVQKIAGRPSSVAIVRYLFGWLCYEIERLAQNERGRSARHAFKMGAVSGMFVDVELGGAGKGFEGKPRIGVHAVATINPQDYGLPALFTDPIQIQIDTEFERSQ